MQIYEDLMNLKGVSGNEKLVRDYFVNSINNNKNFTLEFDNLGSVFGIKKARNKNAKTLMIAAHLDEVGFMVSSITKNGHLKLQPLGGFKPEVLLSQVLDLTLDNGDLVKGVIGSLPPHIKDANKTKVEDFLFDIGLESKEEAIKRGVRPGQMVSFPANYTKTINPNRIISKAVDNRFGCGLAIEIINEFNEIDLDVNLIVGATVQEEVGLRGAKTSVSKFKPDMFIALDASPVDDLLKTENAKLGAGFLLRLHDPRNTMLEGIRNYFLSVATKNNFKYQPFISLGGTDAARALDQLGGVLATTIGLPARYIHSSAAMMDYQDVIEARKMVYQIIRTINNDEIEKIKAGYLD